MSRRLAAIVALVVGVATVALAVAVAVSEFPRGLVLLACVLVAGASAWYGVLRRGVARVAALTVAALAEPRICELYERGLVLVRPDGHVAWRADTLPGDPLALADRVRGAHALST